MANIYIFLKGNESKLKKISLWLSIIASLTRVAASLIQLLK